LRGLLAGIDVAYFIEGRGIMFSKTLYNYLVVAGLAVGVFSVSLSAESIDRSSSFSIGPSGFTIGAPGFYRKGGITVSNGQISTTFSLTGNPVGGSPANDTTAPIYIMPAAPDTGSQLTDSSVFFKSVGVPPPTAAESVTRRPSTR
jgi:hypothetical protein